MNDPRFDRQIALFGRAGQEKLRHAHVTVIGVGGLGTHVVQQLALLGVGYLTLVDMEQLAASNRNRYVGATWQDPIPGSFKVHLGSRIASSVDPTLKVATLPESVVSRCGFEAVREADFVVGCLDNDGARLILTELCAAYSRPYLDLATDVNLDGTYGGRVVLMTDEPGCPICFGTVDLNTARNDLRTLNQVRDERSIYGVDKGDLGETGPSVVSLNGVVASLGVTELTALMTGLRRPRRVLTYRGDLGVVTARDKPDYSECLICCGIRGSGSAAGTERFLRQ